MSIYRLRLLAVGAANFILCMALCMCFLTSVYWYIPHLYSPVLYLAIHTLHLVIIFVLCWLFETPLETVQEAARWSGGPWAQRQRALNPKQRWQEPLCGDDRLKDYCFYTKAGTFISLALAHWTFWLWLILPECALSTS